MKKIMKIFAAFICLMIFAGCAVNSGTLQGSSGSGTGNDSGASSDAPKYEKITYLVCTGDPATYNVYVITPESITFYDLTQYWCDAPGGYYYFSDEMPDAGEYTEEQTAISSEAWEKLVNSLTENKFEKLPEDMHVEGNYDGTTFYIESESEDGTHLSGGYCAGLGDGKKHKRFNNIVVAINEVIRDAEEKDKEQSLLSSGTPESENLTEAATAELFEALDGRFTYSDITDLIGSYDDINEETVPRLFGWELEDGGTAWLAFGEGNRVSDIELKYEDRSVILLSGLSGAYAGPDAVYHDLLGSLSGDERDNIEMTAMMIHDEIDGDSGDENEPHPELLSVLGSSDCYIINAEIISDPDDEPVAYVRFVMFKTGVTDGYKLRDYEYCRLL